MYPFLLDLPAFDLFGYTLGPFRLPSFGIMILLGVLTGRRILIVEFKRKQINPDLVDTLVIASVLCGLVGSKLYFILFELPPYMAWTDAFAAFFSGGGMTWHGGFLFALLVVLVIIKAYRAPVLSVLDTLGIVFAAGYAIGRIGCQLAGDGDYGIPTSLPWGMAYPNGLIPTLETVHPTPVYETLAGLAIFAFLWTTRTRTHTPGSSFCLYLILAGLARFAVEFLRLNPDVLWGLTDAQLVSIGMLLVGTIGIFLLPSISLSEKK